MLEKKINRFIRNLARVYVSLVFNLDLQTEGVRIIMIIFFKHTDLSEPKYCVGLLDINTVFIKGREDFYAILPCGSLLKKVGKPCLSPLFA